MKKPDHIVIRAYGGKYWHYEASSYRGTIAVCGQRMRFFDRWLDETRRRDEPDFPVCPKCQKIKDELYEGRSR